MIIKPAKSSSLLFNTLVLTGLLAVFVTVVLVINNNRKGIAALIEEVTSTADDINKETTLHGLLDHFQNHTIFLSVNDDAAAKMSSETRKMLKKIGGDTLAAITLRQSYTGIFKNGKIINEAITDTAVASLSWKNHKIESAGYSVGKYSRLHLNDVIYEGESRGLNLFVVDQFGRLVGIWNFDFFAEENPKSKAANKTGTANLPHIEINIDEQHFLKLKSIRDQAVKTEVLLAGDDDMVPAKLTFKGKTYNIQMRLKGDWTDHLAGDQWSFRVKLKDESALMGMQKFSLHRPKTRNYAGEWLYHQVLADAGIINLQYHFVTVNLMINGELLSENKNLGIYALEEAFDKQVIERNQRREGIILKLDENPLWEERAAFISGKLSTTDLEHFKLPAYEHLNVISFSQNRIIADSSLYKQFLTGSALFRAYINKEKLPSEVFDVELLAKYHAITNLLGADHSLAPHNYRVYYNPVTSKLEPIGFDGNAGYKRYYHLDYYNTQQDLDYQRAYVKAVEEITTDEYIAKLENWPGFQSLVDMMQANFKDYEWPKNLLSHNQRTLMSRINPTHSIRVNFMEITDQKFTVSIENFGRHPVELHNLVYKEQKSFTNKVSTKILVPDSRTTVSFTLDKNFQNIFTKKSKRKAGFSFSEDLTDVKLQYNTLGSSVINQEIILPWKPDRDGLAKSDPFQQEPNAKEFDFLVFDEKAKTITCMAGHWQLDKKLIIPPGYTFVVGPGCRIELMGRFVSIFSFSPFRFIGTKSNPVEVFSKTGDGAGILVLNTRDTSVLKHCTFDNLSNPYTIGWSVTGAVNFYQADVILEYCGFSNNRCEDALNILKSNFRLSNAVFSNIQADAFDGDFVKGTVSDCLFANIGNDAIDVSGSNIEIKDVSIKNAGDKGISAGEDSYIAANGVVLSDCAIAIASKDQSIFELTDCSLKSNQLCFTAFQKKPEFGVASIIANNIQLTGCEVEYLIENGSSLFLNGQTVETVEEVKEKMYGVEFGKSSK